VDRRPSVNRLVRDRDVYYTIRWSALKKSDKYDIVRSVPSEAGIYEIYYMDDYEKLCLFHVGKSWYGGLRNEIRLRTDQELENDARRRSILAEHDSYYRWSLVSSSADMADILFFYGRTYLPGMTIAKGSGRYERIFVNEVDSDKIVTI